MQRITSPAMQVDVVASSVPTAALMEVLGALAEYFADCPHVEFLLHWVRSICLKHGTVLQVQ
jgi:periodic tryptophan protein 2